MYALLNRTVSTEFVRYGKQAITAQQFLGDIVAVAESLPPGRHAINLCADRYCFSVTFFACALRGIVTLLPANRSAIEAQRLKSSYEQCFTVAEQSPADHLLELQPGSHGTADNLTLDPKLHVLTAFTSGSTGEPQPHKKTWELLATWRAEFAALLDGLDLARPIGLVSTVPSWHMYGLEWALMLPTTYDASVFVGPDFYPEDISWALKSFARPTLLVSTPTHLTALHKTHRPQPTLTMSATAPLDQGFANQLQGDLHTQVLEIYGCSEVGSLAHRHTAQETAWHFFNSCNPSLEEGTLSVSHHALEQPVALADEFVAVANGYEFVGRASDIVKIAGKRESLARLNLLLQNVDGVEDGVFYEPERYGLAATGRLGAVVVAPNLDSQSIRQALAEELEKPFLPRPIRFVNQLPREPTSKLPRQALQKLLEAFHD